MDIFAHEKKNDAVQAVSCSIVVNVTFLDPVIFTSGHLFFFSSHNSTMVLCNINNSRRSVSLVADNHFVKAVSAPFQSSISNTGARSAENQLVHCCDAAAPVSDVRF